MGRRSHRVWIVGVRVVQQQEPALAIEACLVQHPVESETAGARLLESLHLGAAGIDADTAQLEAAGRTLRGCDSADRRLAAADGPDAEDDEGLALL